MDYSSLNKVCAKDMYPFLEVEEKLGSFIGYQYKCFLRLPKEDSQVRISENDKEKTGFHTEEGVYCFTHMLQGLKNYGATLQRVMDKVLRKQNGQNVEVYLEEVVMKSKMEEGMFLGYMAATEGIKADPKKVKVIRGKRVQQRRLWIGMVLVDPKENEYSHAIRLNLFASKDNMDYEALLAGLAAFV
ncbi:hypothetical protein Tco_0834296 [Tanacetum coccineum]